MTTSRLRLAASLALAAALAAPAGAKDVYKAFLDPGNPQHRATLDLLAKLETSPNDAGLHNDLGCLIARDGFWRDALREFDAAAKLDKKDGRPSYNKGLVQATRGEWGAARSAFKQAVDRAPGNWPAWWMLGFAEEKLGNANAAVKAYATSLRVDTSLFDVRRNPWASQTRLKARTLLETYDRRMARASLPATEQLEATDLTQYQSGRVGVTTTTAPVGEEAVPPARTGTIVAPGGSQAAVAPGPGGTGYQGGAVVTSVPPVSSSRPAPPPQTQQPAYTAPVSSGSGSSGLEPAPPWFPQQSPAGPAPARTPAPAQNPDPGPPPTPKPAPPPGPGIG